MSRVPKPYGAWPSPITSELLTSAGVSFGGLCVTGDHVYWTEGRPLEGGRVSIVCDGVDVIPPTFNARTRAHEYGGGAFTVHADTVFFSNFNDQRIYRVAPGAGPEPITPAPPAPAGLRYADARPTRDGAGLICVRERHETGNDPVNEIIFLPTDGSSDSHILLSGHDFYSSPRLSPDGRQLAWLTWDHPDMPWDNTVLWAGELTQDRSIAGIRKVAGGIRESVFQPEWSPEGTLHYISDRTGWWNLYSERSPLLPMEAEFGSPQWVFDLSRYGFLNNGRIACIYSRNGLDHLGILSTSTGSLETLALPHTSFSDIRTDGSNHIFTIASSASIAPEILKIDTDSKASKVLKKSMTVAMNPQDLSTPEPIEFPIPSGGSAYALYYAPQNSSAIGPAGERPPLLVLSHGGPTSAATSSLKLGLQFWTSRGFAVVDVNYRGSTGYGRSYREALNGAWGIADVEDCIEAARYLALRGDVDSRRMAIRGWSAGGYTTLCALTFHNVFAAGASHFGVGDLAALALDTHKFESRYLDRLIGPYPEAADTYRQRSPVHFADKVSCPVILFQGLDDKVVPPDQAEAFVSALQAKGLPCEYVTFPGEGHGFRKAETIQRAAEAELAFYARVFAL